MKSCELKIKDSDREIIASASYEVSDGWLGLDGRGERSVAFLTEATIRDANSNEPLELTIDFRVKIQDALDKAFEAGKIK